MYLHDLAESLLVIYPDFAKFLLSSGVRKEDLLGAVSWVSARVEYLEAQKRWWSKANLDRIPGLAKDWGFGNTYTLDKYSTDLAREAVENAGASDFTSRLEEIGKLENILSKSRQANAILAGQTAEEALSVVRVLAVKIKNGDIVPALEHKRPVLFSSAIFLSAFPEKTSLEKELLKIFDESARAGNIIFVIDDLRGLIAGLDRVGSSFFGLVGRYLESGVFQVIGLSSVEVFHRHLETDASLMTYFDKIVALPLSLDTLIENIKRQVWEAEARAKIFFTYPALVEIVRSADSYFADGDSTDKVSDLLAEILPWAGSRRVVIVGLKEVQQFIRGKTNIPIGEIGAEERDKLTNLEAELKKRVIGQEEAVTLTASALRRSRAGVRNPNRPIGSFLFLGPTGVGKTETAKALADVFFGGEANLMRLDMSEFQGADALEKLIGSVGGTNQGILATMLREKPYGVLLLDEFEKTGKDTLNLFLQILDEGFFSDSTGKRVNARNIIFIATSNAGAEKIWDWFKKGEKLKGRTDELVDEIVTRGIFRPELLNRFDAVVLYEPLGPAALKQIAGLMLAKLAKRLESQGVTLTINDPLAEATARLGANEVFGARPMQRFIQDNIEQQVADGIIAGRVGRGTTVVFEVATDGRLSLKSP